MKKTPNIFPTLETLWHYVKKICLYLLLLMLILMFIGIVIPLMINEAYKSNKGYITLWNAADVLVFYGSFISFIGSAALGGIAVYQNIKAHKLNEQMQKLQQAQFVSMISVKHLEINKRSSTCPNFNNPTMKDLEVFNLTESTFESTQSYHLDIEFSNSSSYPIVQIDAHAGSLSNKNSLIFGITDLTAKAIYIPEHGTKAVRFIVPSKVFEKLNMYKLDLNLKFTNIFDYATLATVYIDDLENKKKNSEYKFRLAKFTDVKS